MSTRTKEEFEQLGYTHASNGDVRSYKPDSTSWQGLAYNAGVQRYGRELPVVTMGGRRAGKSRMAEMMREAGYTPPQSPPEKPIKIWFDELQHNTPANRWSDDPHFAGWPSGAVEHAKRLAEELRASTDLKRAVRLIEALTRLNKRHGTPA